MHPSYTVAEYVAGVQSGMILDSEYADCDYYPAWMTPEGRIVAVRSHGELHPWYEAGFQRGDLRLTIEWTKAQSARALGVMTANCGRVTPAQVDALLSLQAEMGAFLGRISTDGFGPELRSVFTEKRSDFRSALNKLVALTSVNA